MTKDEIKKRSLELERSLLKAMHQVADTLRMTEEGCTSSLHVEAQFWRRLRSKCQKEIDNLEGIMNDPDHYSPTIVEPLIRLSAPDEGGC
jgi:hypothetical protein